MSENTIIQLYCSTNANILQSYMFFFFRWMYVERRNDSEQLYEGRGVSEKSPRFKSKVIEKLDYGTILKR